MAKGCATVWREIAAELVARGVEIEARMMSADTQADAARESKGA